MSLLCLLGKHWTLRRLSVLDNERMAYGVYCCTRCHKIINWHDLHEIKPRPAYTARVESP